MEGEQHLRGRSEEPNPPQGDAIRSPTGCEHLSGFVEVADGLKILGAINAQIKALEAQRFETVRDLRHAGATWPEIAAALGERTATVYQRWARRI